METSRYGQYLRSFKEEVWGLNGVINFNARWPMIYLLSILFSSPRLAQDLSLSSKWNLRSVPEVEKCEFNGVSETSADRIMIPFSPCRQRFCDRLATKSIRSLFFFLVVLLLERRYNRWEENKYLHNKLLLKSSTKCVFYALLLIRLDREC